MNQNPYLQELKRYVLGFLGSEPVRIVLFGSRAREDSKHASDVDVGIIPYGPVDDGKIAVLREKIEQINILYKVEIVIFSETSNKGRFFGRSRSETKRGIL